jgi:hypothetical protein
MYYGFPTVREKRKRLELTLHCLIGIRGSYQIEVRVLRVYIEKSKPSWWLTPVILTTQEAEIRKLMV